MIKACLISGNRDVYDCDYLGATSDLIGGLNMLLTQHLNSQGFLKHLMGELKQNTIPKFHLVIDYISETDSVNIKIEFDKNLKMVGAFDDHNLKQKIETFANNFILEKYALKTLTGNGNYFLRKLTAENIKFLQYINFI